MTDDPRAAAVLDTSVDDLVLPFAVEGLDVRGRVARLGPALDAILERHDYPVPVASVLAEAMTLTVLLGSSLKIDGRFILQTQSDGPVGFLVVDFATPDRIRGYASYDPERIAGVDANHPQTEGLLGEGHLAMTIDQGPQTNRYQGVVPLDGRSLEDAAHLYFRQSEQIPTRVRLAAARAFKGGEAGLRWRAGGIVIQHLPPSGPERQADLPPGDAPEGAGQAEVAEADEWAEARMLLETVENHELIDPTIAVGQLLMRLYHERGVRVFDPLDLKDECRCSYERIFDMLAQFSPEERSEMVKDGRIIVTCEFCSTRYEVDPAELEEGAGKPASS